MSIKVFFDNKAQKEFKEFAEPVQMKFDSVLKTLRESGRLDFPDGRKIDKNLYELRIKYQGEFRGLYAYIIQSQIVVLHFFRKKTQKTPIKDLKTAKRRLKFYER